MLNFVASKSKDRSSKVAAIIVGPDNEIRSTGYNGFPSGCDDDYEPWHQRPKKYLVTEHAERNAIYLAARHGVSLKGCTIYVSGYSCTDCMRAIIQTGISRVIVNTEYNSMSETYYDRWKPDIDVAMEMAKQSGVKIYLYANGKIREIDEIERY